MKVAFILALSLLVLGGSAHAEAPSKEKAERVYAWLVAHQGDGELLGNQEGETFSGLYPNALAAICFIHQGDVERAERIFQVYRRNEDVCKASPGGFFQFWDASNGTPRSDSDRWIGDNAWLLIALNYYRAQTGKTDFDGLRDSIARWLIGLQDKDGGIWSGFNAKGPMLSKATEGNLDCYAALSDHPKERKLVRKFLESQMWIPKEKRFRMGSTSYDPALDCAAWSVAALGPKFREALNTAEKMFLQKQTSNANGNEIQGFADLKGHQRIWLEGTGEMVVAYRVAGNRAEAEKFLLELEKAMIKSRRFEATLGLPCHTNDPPWPGGDQVIFVPSQAWYLFGSWGFNPLASPGGP